MDKNLKRSIEKGNLRMMWFCIFWSAIGAIPLLILSASLPAYHSADGFGIWQFAIIGWMIWVIIGTAISPRVAMKFYKD